MQMTIYYEEKDEYLLEKVEEKATRDRRSRSATILSILEQYFEGGRKLGKILIDMGALSPEELRVALRLQRESMSDQRIGEILRKEGYVMEVDVDRALQVQGSGSDSIY